MAFVNKTVFCNENAMGIDLRYDCVLQLYTENGDIAESEFRIAYLLHAVLLNFMHEFLPYIFDHGYVFARGLSVAPANTSQNGPAQVLHVRCENLPLVVKLKNCLAASMFYCCYITERNDMSEV